MGTGVVPEMKAVIQRKNRSICRHESSQCDKGQELTAERYAEIQGRKINCLGPCLFFFFFFLAVMGLSCGLWDLVP